MGVGMVQRKIYDFNGVPREGQHFKIQDVQGTGVIKTWEVLELIEPVKPTGRKYEVLAKLVHQTEVL